MLNTPIQQPSQFQQKAQMRLQEMEVEWRRTLFERFRGICREEMMEVMKTLLDTMQGPQEMAQRLEALHHSQQAAQQEVQELLHRTCEEMKNLSERMEQPPPAMVDTSSLEVLAKEAAQRQEQLAQQTLVQQEKAIQTIQDDVRQSTEVTRRSSLKVGILIAVITALVCVGAMVGLKYLGKFTVVSERELMSQRQAEQTLQGSLKSLEQQKATSSEELAKLNSRRDAMEDSLKRNSEQQRAAAASLSAIQQQITRLQQLQDQFRFKLVKGEDGGVFVEIAEDAKPFPFENRTFIQVK